MQINRCFELVYLLLERGKMTAGQLAEHFEVSIRTIYRDIDTLSLAGIPIYCTKGKGGGVQLMEEFVMNKSLLSEQERNQILFGIQSLQAAKYPEIEELHSKLAGLFGQGGQSWVEIDFGGWDPRGQQAFKLLRQALTEKRKVEFDYINNNGESSHRTVEPMKLTFRDHMWYLEAYCELRQDFRMFKLRRIRHLKLLEETFAMRELPETLGMMPPEQWMTVKIQIDQSLAFRVYDEFEESLIQRTKQGDFVVKFSFPADEWIYNYLMSYGDKAKVLEPVEVREKLIELCQSVLKLYP